MASLGMHLMMEARVSKVLYNRETGLTSRRHRRLLLGSLYTIVRSIGMTPISGKIVDHPWGPSGWLMLSESHICFDYMYGNAAPEWWAVTADLFSCRIFNAEAAQGRFIDLLHMIEPIQHRAIYRGLKLGPMPEGV